MGTPRFVRRLRSRKVPQWVVAYSAAAVVVFQGLEILAEPWGLGRELQRAVHVLLLAGLLLTAVAGWYHGKAGRQRVRGSEAALVLLILAVTAGALAVVTRPRHGASGAGAAAPVATHRQLTFTGEARSPALSPDGEAVAYIGSSDYFRSPGPLYIKEVGGDAPVHLADWADDPTWIDGGRALLFSGPGGVWQVPRRGGGAELILPHAGPFAADPRSDAVVLVRRGRGLVVRRSVVAPPDTLVLPEGVRWVDAVEWARDRDDLLLLISQHSGSAIARLSVNGNGGVMYRDAGYVPSARWGPDGEVYFVRNRSLYRLGPDATNAAATPVPLLSGIGIRAFSLDASGRRLAYERLTERRHLWEAVPAREDETPSPDIARTVGTGMHFIPAVSPDGSRIAFVRGARGEQDIWVAGRDGGTPSRVTRLQSWITQLEWSPDGGALAFAAELDGETVPMIVALDGKPPRRVGRRAAIRGYYFPPSFMAWARDSALFFLSPDSAGTWQLARIDPFTGQERLFDLTGDLGLAVSPERDRLALGSSAKITIISLEGQPLDSLRLDPLIAGAALLGWTDGDLWLLEGQENEIWRQPIRGTAERIGRVPAGCGRVSITPERTVLCDRSADSHDIWIADTFDLARSR